MTGKKVPIHEAYLNDMKQTMAAMNFEAKIAKERKVLYYHRVRECPITMLSRRWEAICAMQLPENFLLEVRDEIAPFHLQFPDYSQEPKYGKGKNHLVWLDHLIQIADDIEFTFINSHPEFTGNYNGLHEKEISSLANIFYESEKVSFPFIEEIINGIKDCLAKIPARHHAFAILNSLIK